MTRGDLPHSIENTFGSTLITAEVAMAFVVLAGAALPVRSFVALLSEAPGFDAKGVLAMEMVCEAFN
jgi:hypothetical protein